MFGLPRGGGVKNEGGGEGRRGCVVVANAREKKLALKRVLTMVIETISSGEKFALI